MTAAVGIQPANPADADPPKKTDAMRNWVGQRPLQRAKLLVRIAIKRSRGLSMIRVDTTPAALHPNPMTVVMACLPWAPAVLNNRSRLKATLGR